MNTEAGSLAGRQFRGVESRHLRFDERKNIHPRFSPWAVGWRLYDGYEQVLLYNADIAFAADFQMNIADMKIEYPGTLSEHEKRFIFDAFSAGHGSEVSEWISIEKDPAAFGDDALKEISTIFRNFIRLENEDASIMAISSLFMDMRDIIHAEI